MTPKLCLRRVVSREKVLKGTQYAYWKLGLECGHSVKRTHSLTGGRGEVVVKAHCEECWRGGERTETLKKSEEEVNAR